MADYSNPNSTQNFEVVTEGDNFTLRRSIAHLPAFYRTPANEKFLTSTIDPLIQKGQLKRLDGYTGRLDAYTRTKNDTYLDATTTDRTAYQLEQTVTYIDKDTTSINPEDQIKFTGTYDDFLNQLKYFNVPLNNHDRITKEKTYGWNPAVDLDKLINYREYYWLPTGPNLVNISTVGKNTEVEYDVSTITEDGSSVRGYVFGHKKNEQNPTITLYRGNTYKFNIDAPGHPFNLMTEPVNTGVAEDGSTSIIYSDGVTNNGTDKGTVTFTVPTSAPNSLFYQCGNHANMHGIFLIKTVDDNTLMDPTNDIVGVKNYKTSKIKFTNGLKIKFGTAVVNDQKETYADKEFYVEGVGSNITLTPTEDLLVPESYSKLTTIPFDNYGYDQRPYAKAFYLPETPDYITIKRDSIDQNAWSRYNRWFHKSVIEDIAKANDATAEIDETARAQRPIIEFDSNLKLFNFGTVAKKSVTLVDSVTTDAFSTIVNQGGYYIDGIQVSDGMRVLFTADEDSLVKNKIFRIKVLTIQGESRLSLQLEETSDTSPLEGESVYVEFGAKHQGKTYYYTEKAGPNKNEKKWELSQEKTKLNQQPKFDLFDADGISFSDDTVYLSNNFVGSEIFNYATSTAAVSDTVLGFKVKYNTVNNTGDIVFESDYNKGSFTYKPGDEFLTKKYSTGFLHVTKNVSQYDNRVNWIETETESKQRVKRTFFATEKEKKIFPIDFYKGSASLTDIEVSVKVNGIFKTLDTDYTLVNGTSTKFVKFTEDLLVNDIVTIYGYSATDKVSKKGIYEIPDSLSNNPLNSTLESFTYGQIANHLSNVISKNTDVTGTVPGVSNIRDFPDAYRKGGMIQQHSGSMPTAVFNLIDKEANFISALDYTRREYEKFKEKFLSFSTSETYEGDPVTHVDNILTEIAKKQTSAFPFYYEDMLGWGETYSKREYTVMDSLETSYALDSQHSITSLSNRAVYVYLNKVQLCHGEDYTFSTTDDSVTILKTLAEGDTLEIRDYGDTTGSFVPVTPAKLGLRPKYKPESVSDNSYLTTQTMIIGHDGSRTKAYGDFRDDILLELEKRIYNNIKVAYNKEDAEANDIIPSAFAKTDYSLAESNGIIAKDFYKWSGNNNIDYRINDVFLDAGQFTWNYSFSKDINGENAPGHWRGIYQYYFDTQRPHQTPWEMLGYSEKPTGWDARYGVAPYTSGNEVLWDDLERGYDYVQNKVIDRYARPNLKQYLPVNENGTLVSPIQSQTVNGFTRQNINGFWKFGDHGPAETAWRNSSSYQFSLVKLQALANPVKFFGIKFDPSRLTKNVADNFVSTETNLRQRLVDSRYHLETITNDVTGAVTRYQTAGFQPMTVNYLIGKNQDPAIYFYDKMKNLNVQLSYKLGGFTAKDNLRILTDSLSPGSTSGSQFVPSENYHVAFRASNPVKSYYYSGLLIEKNSAITSDGSTVAPGYRVLGYDSENPYFNVYAPIQNTNRSILKTGKATAIKYSDFVDFVQEVPYGTVFSTAQEVIDFIIGYEKYLISQGFRFNSWSSELGATLNWTTSAKEFLYWTTQGWGPGSAIVLSPGASGFQLETKNVAIGKLQDVYGNYSAVDAGGRSISVKDLSTKRGRNNFELTVRNEELGLYGINLHAVEKEHILIFDNKTVFNDIIFDISTGYRQQRLKLIGWKTDNWSGDFFAPGFVFDNAKVSAWTANTDYLLGDNVEYNAKFYVAKVNHNSGTKFDIEVWTKKDKKPEAKLYPNFDYRISQFNDFYGLETNNFDSAQEKLAQHLTGYQSRDYLENLFKNEVSQYKFYQGFVREKGTENALNKLVKAKFLDEDIDLSIYPEWMIKQGEFGNTDSDKAIQIKLPDTSVLTDPVSIEMFDSDADTKQYDRSFGVSKDDLYEKPLEFTASTAFGRYDYANGIDKDNVQFYKTAGYPRLDDVQHTAFNIADILNLDVNQLTKNDLIWIANNESNDWDVQRVFATRKQVKSIASINNDTQLQFEFTGNHDLSLNSKITQYVMISDSQYSDINKVFAVTSVPSNTSIIVDYDGPKIGAIQNLKDGSSVSTYGNLSKFQSVRFDTIDNIYDRISFNDFRNKDTVNSIPGDKIFIDSNTAGKWNVYEKVVPTVNNTITSPNLSSNSQNFGWQTVARDDGKYVAISAPDDTQGKVHFFFRKSVTAGTQFGLNRSFSLTSNNDATSRCGYSMSISTDDNWLFAGAPYYNIDEDGSTVHEDQGALQSFQWDPVRQQYTEKALIHAPHNDSTNRVGANFGWSHASAELATNEKYLFVGAPGFNTDEGQVFVYKWSVGADGSTYDTWTEVGTPITAGSPTSSDRFGHKVVTNDNGDIVAISAVSSSTAGRVEIFVRGGSSNDGSTKPTWTRVQTLQTVASDGSSMNNQFGADMSMSKDGKTLVISAPGAEVEDGSTGTFQNDAGKVFVYQWNLDGSTNQYTQTQSILPPSKKSNIKFGSSVHINKIGNRIAIGSEGKDNPRRMLFDSGETTFDLQDTNIVDMNKQSGSVFVATKYNTKFIIDEEKITNNVSGLDAFGKSVHMLDNSLFIGSPQDDVGATDDGSVAHFDTSVSDKHGWTQLREETNFIDNRKISSAFIFDRSKNTILDYIQYYDPIKGQIFGLADKELKYKTTWDPASYNYNPTGSNQSKTAWGEEHIGETWWDLSKVKWVWYEQGDQEYKTKNWGKIFPGSSIDVYEWVESTLLPSEWNNQADTTNGLSNRISGMPLDPTNNSFTVKQKYDSKKNEFINYYYYWVKGSVFVPGIGKTVFERNNSTAIISNLLTNPKLSGLKYFGVSDQNKIILYNVKYLLQDDNIVFNINYKTNTGDASRHQVWKIFAEGDPQIRPSTEIESKWWDSLVGHDASGNVVPDKSLPVNRRYGTLLRPRQSWYVNRFKALKEIIGYTNTILKAKQLVGTISFTNLNLDDPQPTATSGEYDGTVATYEDLGYLNTADFSGKVKYLVTADENIGGLWAIHEWSGTEWTRIKVQTYKTSKYWTYADWYKTDGAMSHNENTRIDKQVQYEYELDSLDLTVGQHVKVTTSSGGGWKVFMKTATGWENVATQNGTIQISSDVYDYTISSSGFAGTDTFDTNFYDDEPTAETRNILTALRDDIFVGDLEKEYNTIFFIGLRYVLSEQTYVDWLSKTSFLNITNSLRPLNQRKSYSTGKDDYVEKYISEVKPYSTKVREYKLKYTSDETLKGLNTDFDLPPFYDVTQAKTRPIETSGVNDQTKLTEFPWNTWKQYHTKYIKSITITKSGSGYQTTPTVSFIGGVEEETGPYTLLGRSNSGTTSGTYGYFYPLYTQQVNANIADQQNGGTGSSHSHTFEEYPNRTFYMPDSMMNHGVATDPGTYKIFAEGTQTHATATAVVSDGKVQKINITTNGVGYTTTPQIILTGGRNDGSTPTDFATAYAVLDNDLVRDINTTIKFDRISSTANIVDWAKNTTYEYGALLRYNNELYRTTSRITTGNTFDVSQFQKLRGDESYINAALRTKGFYAPSTGMPGNELSQVMSGVDYGGVIVTGLGFDNSQGWDQSDWTENSWDTYGLSRIRTFYADGSTNTFTFPSAPAVGEVYTTYFDGVLQASQVFHGDGSTLSFTLSSTPATGVKVQFIPFDDDGVQTPTDDRTLDTLLSGGLFSSALGISPDSVILEGDEFVSPDTSYAPEETVPGQIFDTLDLKVYTAPESGVPFISSKSYVGDGNTKTFDIGGVAQTQDSVSVVVSNVAKRLTTDYTVNIQNKTITFVNAPSPGQIINIKSFAVSGSNYMVLNKFIGDGSTASFTTSARTNFQGDSTNSQLYVTVNGVPTTAFTSTSVANTITLTFNTPPAADASIQIAGFNQASGRAYAEIRTETITYDGSTTDYPLTYPLGTYGPYSGLTIVEHNGKILRGPDHTYYTGDGSTYTYKAVTGLSDDSTVDPAKVITASNQVEVFVNAEKQYLNVHYTVDLANQNVEFLSPPTSSDVIAIVTLVDHHYNLIGDNLRFQITQLAADGQTLNAGNTVRVTTFNNALGMKQRREIMEGRSSGEHFLMQTPLNQDYVYVWFNGIPLVAGNDFTVTENKVTIAGRTITLSDRIDVMYFAVPSATGATGFRIFKDMLNRTFFKRINENSTTEISNDVTETAKTISVVDGTKLSDVDGSSAIPGVIFVDKERIEYFNKSGNVLSNLRRGTLGTGIKAHTGGTQVVDASGNETVPYADTVYTNTHTGDGSTTVFATTIAPTSASQLDIFIGGQRVLLTSEDGSTVNYSVDGSTANVTFTTVPASGSEVKIIQKRGQVWYTAGSSTASDGKGLQKSQTMQAKFIAGEPTNAPE